MPKSKLEKAISERLRKSLNGVIVLENIRPDWLISSQGERLELDFYLPELNLAIEVQGRQHYIYTPHFHDDENGFYNQLRRDREKHNICQRKGIDLLEISGKSDIDHLIKSISNRIPEQETGAEFVLRMKEYNRNTSILTRRKLKLNKKYKKLFDKSVSHIGKIDELLKNKKITREQRLNLEKKRDRIQDNIATYIKRAKNV